MRPALFLEIKAVTFMLYPRENILLYSQMTQLCKWYINTNCL